MYIVYVFIWSTRYSFILHSMLKIEEEDVDQSRKKREHEIENEVVLMVNCNPLRGFLG